MPDLSKLKIEWMDIVKLASVLVAVMLAWAAITADLKLVQSDVRRFENQELQALRRKDQELTAQVQRLRDEATAERLRQTELLTEVRTDVRQMRAIIERLDRAVPRP